MEEDMVVKRRVRLLTVVVREDRWAIVIRSMGRGWEERGVW
jgi:hypothetical protein